MSRDATTWRELVLDPASAPHRRILVEASAGTGKTWTISAIYLRLVVEHGLRPESIVVSTFTDAAAAELRERIRTRLLWALRSCDDGTALAAEATELRHWFATQATRLPPEDMRWRLQAALAELERAPIATLHALCKRILAEQAVAAGSALRLGELVPEDALRDELLEDLTRWLAHAAGDDETTGLPALQRMPPLARAKLLQAAMQPGLHLVGGEVEELHEVFADSGWPARLRDFAATLPLRPRKSALRTRLGELADWIDGADIATAVDTRLRDKFKELFAEANWHEQLVPERAATILADPVAQFARRAAAALIERDALLCAQGVRRVLPMLAAWRASRLSEREQLSFDDLIGRVHAQAILARDTPGHLADRLHARWPVALIDEFQDTDARQWAIFDALHRDRDGAVRGLLLLIGDPKQAIYGFRGSDIATYLRAAATTTQRLTLAVNQRASTGLVAATNALYGARRDAFAMDDAAIRYPPVQAAGRADAAPLVRMDDAPWAPLQLHAATADAFGLCAALIADYLAPGRWRIGDRALAAGDIAVLLPRHADIEALREVLQRHDIPCVSGGRSDVFASPWAEELRIVLHALAQPSDAGALRAALATRLLGAGYGDLHRYAADEAAWRARVEPLSQWADAWERHGVLRAVDEIVASAAPRLLARLDGERALTDLRHLGELLQAEAQHRPGRHRLLAWFAARCDGTAQRGEAGSREHELRIESDAGRVQLLTLHASKGLEFPIVLLPRMDAQRGVRIDHPAWTDAERGIRCLDLGSARLGAHRALAARDGLQERARLLYVALTRAIHACHVVLPDAGTVVDDQASALAWLLHEVDLDGLAATVPEIARVADGPTPAPARPATAVARARKARAWPNRRALDAAYSFSSLMARAAATWHEDEAAQDEAVAADIAIAEAVADPRLQALDEWRGVAFGNVLHAVFELRERARPIAEQRALVHEQLARAGLRVDTARAPRLVDAVIERVQATLDADLGDGLRLGEIEARAERAEMGFQCRIDRLDLAALRRLCDGAGETGLLPAALGETRLRGFLSGKIDLVLVHGGAVHVLDYKSNRLGDRLADYEGMALDRAMSEHGYRWQALIYAIAVRRYLARRQRDRAAALPLGDAIYLFVRAVGLAPGAGVWRHRFAPDFVAAVDALFATAEASNP
jgi:exodeoxyribonuclease V beta subunit